MKSRCKISMTKRIFTTLWVLCLTCKLGFGQDMVLSGTVKDVQGSPMPGVAVLISGHVLVIKQRPGILVDDARNSQSARALEFLDGEGVL